MVKVFLDTPIYRVLSENDDISSSVTGIAEHPTADWGLVLEEREHSETGGISKFHFSAFFII